MLVAIFLAYLRLPSARLVTFSALFLAAVSFFWAARRASSRLDRWYVALGALGAFFGLPAIYNHLFLRW